MHSNGDISLSAVWNINIWTNWKKFNNKPHNFFTIINQFSERHPTCKPSPKIFEYQHFQPATHHYTRERKLLQKCYEAPTWIAKQISVVYIQSLYAYKGIIVEIVYTPQNHMWASDKLQYDSLIAIVSVNYL